MKLYTYKLAFRWCMAFLCLWTIRGFVSSFQNRSARQPIIEKKELLAKCQQCFKTNDRRDYCKVFIKVLMYECGRLEVFFLNHFYWEIPARITVHLSAIGWQALLFWKLLTRLIVNIWRKAVYHLKGSLVYVYKVSWGCDDPRGLRRSF